MSRPMTPVFVGHTVPPVHLEASVHPASSSGLRPTSVSPGPRPVSYIGSHVPGPSQHVDQPYGPPRETSVLTQAGDPLDETHVDAGGTAGDLHRSNSPMSGSQLAVPARGGTLKKKPSLHKTASLRRTNSKRSSYAGSVRSMKLGEKEKYGETDESNSAFYCPVPTSGSPTELLATRFQAWRKVLKDLITYFRELQKSYDTRAKTLQSTSNMMNNTTIPSNFLTSGGLGDATHILRDFHKQALNEAHKARELENEVIMQLTGLRSDLQQKIKEIKSLSGDFKNSVDKEQEGTKKAVRTLQEALGMVDHDAAATSGKGDPFIIKMAVDRQVERQIEEENYLHRAYLNLEASGRELESIVIGEIQKAYNVLAGVLRREADDNYDTAERLKEGPLALAKDLEWEDFVTSNDQMVDPRRPLRQVSHITYPGKDHPAAIEVRSGMLERKSKYLKNYTPGWYILSPTHLHEFKSADRIAFQSPVMSLYLPEQKLGSHSEPGSSSHKFMLKGRQTGSMHRGHAWVFRAETHDTMMAWFNDIKELTEKRGEARNDFVRRTHARSLSGNSLRAASIVSSEGGLEEDEADRVAFSGEQSVRGQSAVRGAAVAGGGVLDAAGVHGVEDTRSDAGWRPQRPAPGGHFPSEVNVTRGLQAPVSPSSGGSDERDREAAAAATAAAGAPFSHGAEKHIDLPPAVHDTPAAVNANPSTSYIVGHHPSIVPASAGAATNHETASQYGEWMAPLAAGAAAGAGVVNHQQRHQQPESHRAGEAALTAVPPYGLSSAPISVATAGPVDDPTQLRPISDSPTEAHTVGSTIAPTASSATDAGTVSTAPTSSYAVHHESLLDNNGVLVQPSAAGTAPTEPGVKTHADRSTSLHTLSDLHVPGEFR